MIKREGQAAAIGEANDALHSSHEAEDKTIH